MRTSLMKIYRFAFRNFLLLTFIWIMAFQINAQDRVPELPDSLLKALNKGLAKDLTVHLQESINLEILSQAGVYGKLQSEEILDDFFRKHRVDQFILQRNGQTGSSNNLFTIGELVCGSDRFRVYFVRSKEGAKYLIHSLSITAIKK
jgi:hypothetical protein